MLEGKRKLFNKLSYTPLYHQLQFHNALNKYKGYIGGLGSGKTHAGVFEAIYHILAYPGITGFILAPTNKILKDSTIKAFFKFCPSTIIKYYNRSEQKVYFKNGSEVLFRNGETERDINRLRNIEVGWFWADEARGFPAYIWKVLVGRLRQKGGPLVGWITTTTKGFNWIYKKFDGPDKKPNYFAVHSSSTENTHLPEDYLQNLKDEYTGKFAEQEIHGKYVGFEGTVYEEFTRQDHVLDAVLIKTRDGQLGIIIPDTNFKVLFKEIVLGVDWGFTNPTAIPVIGIDSDGRMYIIDEFYETKVKKEELVEIGKGFLDKYNFRMSFADSNEPEFIAEWDDAHIPIQKAIKDIIPGISEVSNRLKVREDGKPRLYVCANCVNTIKEFENYRYPDKKEDRPEQEKPLKVMDHCLVKGTQVFTSKGNKNIEDIKLGEYVLTRQGFNKVLWGGLTKKKTKVIKLKFKSGKELIGTPKHLIYTNKGWFSMDTISNIYIPNSIHINQCLTKLSFKDLNTLNGKKDIIDMQIRKVLNIFIEKFGNFIMEKYKKDIGCIIKIEIKRIIKSPILSLLLLNNIEQNIQKQHLPKNILKELENLQKYGIEAKKEELGIENMQLKLIKIEKLLKRIVSSAIKKLKLKIQKEDFVIKTVKLKQEEDVYNLHVENCHEFYANGILVHNCMDAIRYAAMGLKESRTLGFAQV